MNWHAQNGDKLAASNKNSSDQYRQHTLSAHTHTHTRPNNVVSSVQAYVSGATPHRQQRQQNVLYRWHVDVKNKTKITTFRKTTKHSPSPRQTGHKMEHSMEAKLVSNLVPDATLWTTGASIPPAPWMQPPPPTKFTPKSFSTPAVGLQLFQSLFSCAVPPWNFLDERCIHGIAVHAPWWTRNVQP